MNIIFMGTAEFAAPILLGLIESKQHNVKAIFTKPPKKQNRGMKLLYSPIHQVAEKYNIPVYTPSKLNNAESKDLINSIDADLIIVAAYGIIINSDILNAKQYGAINIHPSDLPQYRGASPLQYTIINGETDSAVCVIQMDEGIDTGDILLKESFILDNKITLEELTIKTANIGRDLILTLLEDINKFPRIKQSDDNASYAHMLSKEDGRINWVKDTAFEINCKIRGMTPWPGVYFDYMEQRIQIISTDYSNMTHQDIEPGSRINNRMEFICKEGTIIINSLKPAGKGIMSAKAFLNGIVNKNNNKNSNKQ